MKKSMGLWIAGALLILVILLLPLVLAKPAKAVGLCYCGNTTAENKNTRESLERKLQKQGFQVFVVDADHDQAKQIEQIQEIAKRECEILIVEPVMSSAAAELLTVLDSTGLPAVLYGRQIDSQLLQGHPKIAYVGIDAAQPGTIQAQMAISLPDGGDLNGDGNMSYLVIQGAEDHVDTVLGLQSLEAILSEFDAQAVSVNYGDGTQDSGRKLCKQELAAYGKDIEVIFCGNEQIALGAAEAIANGGRTVGTDIYLFAVGEDKSLVDQGAYTGIAWMDPALLAQKLMDTAMAQLSGKTFQQVTVIPYTPAIAEK